MITKTKQNWQIGAKVNVGFLRDLLVVAKIPTPGDWAPDAYLLFAAKGAFYEFVPHNGLRALKEAEVRALVANASEALRGLMKPQQGSLPMAIADNIKASRRAFQSALYAVDQLAECMADAEAPNGDAAYHMHMTHARQALLEAVAALDNRIRTVTLPALPHLPAPFQYETNR